MPNNTKNRYQKILEGSLKNLRASMNDMSLDSFLASTVESLMELERGEYLENIKNDSQKGKDKGNGYYERAFKSFSRNCLSIHVPRTRTGEFNPDTLELVKISQDRVNELCLSLYRKGMTSRDVSDLIKEMFGESVSATKVTNLSKVFHEFRMVWENSKLEKEYKVIFCDCLFVTVKREDSYTKEAVYIAYGVRVDNKREILALAINPTEGATFWGEVLDDLKNKRGVKEIGLIVADGVQGLEEEVHRVYPNAQFQKCVVHKMRNILNKTRPQDKTEMAEDLKNVFDNFDSNATLENALNKMNNFINKWKKKYNQISRFFGENSIEYYFTYIKFRPEVRRSIYTTNSIENINRIIRKATKNKLSFESPGSLLDYVFMVVKEFEDKNFMKYPINNFKYLKLKNDQTQLS